MVIDRNQYIKLYSVAMEEVRHHERVYTETWIGAIFLTSALVAILYFLSQVLFQAPFLASTLFKWFMIISGTSVIWTFYWVVMRRGLIAQTCRQAAKKLEDILGGKTHNDTLKLTQEIEAMQKPKRSFLRSVFLRPWLPFPILADCLWIILCVNLLKAGV